MTHSSPSPLRKSSRYKHPSLPTLSPFSPHGPFTSYRQTTLDKIDLSSFDGITRDYLASIHEVDQAFEQFFEGMKGEGLLQNTIVFLYSDHHPGAIDFEKQCPDECIPLFIYAPGIIEPGINSALSTPLDIPPTILHLLGITPPGPPQWYGSNLFDRFPERQIALLPHYKGLIREKNGPVKKMSSRGSATTKQDLAPEKKTSQSSESIGLSLTLWGAAFFFPRLRRSIEANNDYRMERYTPFRHSDKISTSEPTDPMGLGDY